MGAIFNEFLIFPQENGPDVELVVNGDEFYARYEDLEGFTVVYDADLGLFCYADVLDGQFISTATPADKAAAARRPGAPPQGIAGGAQQQVQPALRAPAAQGAPPPRTSYGRWDRHAVLQGRRLSSGTVRGLTVLVEFADLQSTVTASDVDAMLNGPNYTANGNFCSVRDYFLTVSNGKLDYSNTVVGPIRLSRRTRLSTRRRPSSRRRSTSLRPAEQRLLGVRLEKRTDNRRDQLHVRRSHPLRRRPLAAQRRPEAPVRQLPYPHLHAHEHGPQLRRPFDRHFLSRERPPPLPLPGHVRLRRARWRLRGQSRHRRLLPHGLRQSLDRGRTPSPVCGYLRDLVGWASNEITLNGAGEFAAQHGDYATVFKYETDRPNEYFIVENRSRDGMDKALPAAGLAVYHCDWLGSNEWQGGSANRHYQCGLLQADGHLDLEKNVNGGDAGDLFASRSGIAISHETTPSSRIGAARTLASCSAT